MEKRVKFGDLKVGDHVYWITGLEIEELKILKTNNEGGNQSVTLTIDGRVRGHDWLYVGKYCSSSYHFTIFTSKEEAWEKLIKNSKARHRELVEEIDRMISEFDKLDEFLKSVNGKEKV